MKRPKPIKPFKTLEEEARFWDTHDLSAIFANPETPLAELLSFAPEKKATLTLRLQEAVKKRLEQAARLKGISSSTLTRMWVVEKLMETETTNQRQTRLSAA